MSYSKNVWSQLKNTTAQDIQKALTKDGWSAEKSVGAIQAYRKEFDDGAVKRVTIHVHPKKTYGAKLLQGLLTDIGWTESDLKKLKLIK